MSTTGKALAGVVAAAAIALVLSAAPRAQGCTFSLSRTTVLAGPEGPIFARTTVTPSALSCQWSTTTSASWITVNPNLQSGTADAAITLAPNTTNATRVGLVTVAGQTVTVTQQATPCATSLTPNVLTFPFPGFGDPAGQRQDVTVNAPADCHWQHAPWPIVLSPNPTFGGVGTQTVSVGIITLLPGQGNTVDAGIGSLPLTMTRLDPPCVFTLTPSNPTVSVSGGSGVVDVTGTGTDCSFTATVSGVGLSIVQSGPAAPATVSYTFMPNLGSFPRSAIINVPNASATVAQNGAPARTDVSLLTFGAISDGAAPSVVSPPEDVRLTIDEQPGSAWTATSTQGWLIVTPTSGSGPAVLRLSVDPALVPLPPFPQNLDFTSVARVRIAAAFAPATAIHEVTAQVAVKRTDLAQLPRGVFETPLNNAAGLSGAIPVTGWATDDINVSRVQLFRDPVPGEGTAEVYIGDAIRVAGARPDIASGGIPQSRSAGWGYMLLSNVLPPGGNGTFTFSAYVEDADGVAGHRVLLGRRTATFDNAAATRPFGTIDEPAQGQTVSGTIVNRGWVLTPAGKAIPLDGSTIKVYIDGVLLSPVSSYNHARPDVKAFFPGLGNSDGPEARLSIDTTLLADGVHTIAWGVIDDEGVAEGIGSRYFTVQNGLSSLVWQPAETSRSATSVATLPSLRTDVWSRGGFDETGWAARVETDADGNRTLRAARGQRVELFLDPTLRAPCGTYDGHLLAGEVAAPLPMGASLDRQHGIFRWQPGAETSGTFAFVFVQRGCDAVERRIPLTVVIDPNRP